MKILASSEEKKSLGNWFRERRFKFFKSAILPLIEQKRNAGTLPLTILDVGGTEAYWVNMGFHNDPDIAIRLVNILDIPSHYPNITSVKGDATNLHDIADKEFDIVFSNSVIEHLYTFEAQRKMSLETQRAGRYHFIQTPNKHFFIEPHYVLPFFQYLPKKVQLSVLLKTPLSRGRKWDKAFATQYVDEIRLLSYNEMQTLFPSSKIYKEKFFGMSKSFTAHNFNLD